MSRGPVGNRIPGRFYGTVYQSGEREGREMSEVKSELRVGDGGILIDFVVDLGKVMEQMYLQKLPLAS